MSHLHIYGEGDAERAFMEEWNSAGEFVTAHTSGSTGQPKEIKLRKSDMMKSARSTNIRFAIGSSSRLFSPLSAKYIAGKMMIVRAMEAQCELILETPSNNPLHNDYGGEIDLMAVVPSQCLELIRNPLAHKQLQNLIVGGAPMSGNIERQLHEMPWKTFATYGMTETCSHVALRMCGDSSFEAMPGICFRHDERECLIIDAPDFSFKEITTNDVVELHDPHHFKWLGRFDNVINSGGIKLYPEEIEKQLEGKLPHPFYISAVTDEKWGEAVGLTLLDGSIAPDQALEICRSTLPPYSIPKHIRLKKQLDYTPNGKLKRSPW